MIIVYDHTHTQFNCLYQTVAAINQSMKENNTQFIKSKFSHINGLSMKTINSRSILTALETISNMQQLPCKKESLELVIVKFKQTGDPMVCQELDSQAYQMLTKIRSFNKYFRLAFLQLTTKKIQYFKYEDSNIPEIVMSIQKQINPTDFKASYFRALLQLKKTKAWTNKFIEQWLNKAFHMRQNQIQLREKTQNEQISLKRQGPSQIEDNTETGSQPAKKMKTNSLNYKSVIVAMECVIRHAQGQKKQDFEERLKMYKQTNNPQYLTIPEKEICRTLFDLRSYIKLFMEAFTQFTAKEEYVTFSDKGMIYKIFQYQQLIDPKDILGSYKNILSTKRHQQNWTQKFIQQWIGRVKQLKIRQADILMTR